MLRFITAAFCFFALTPAVFAQDNSCEKHHCIAVVDAGSTGSRLHIYSYDNDSSNSPINIKELWNKKASPGFATLQANTNTINTYLTTLFSDSPIKKIPVYFYATAGMRLLPQTKQNKYYNELNNWFKQHNEWTLKDAKTITGNEEGIYDWLSVNYHLGTFTSPYNRTTGIMDMGGASVQIVFPIAENSAINERSQAKIDIYGQHYTLYVHSFLGLGQTEISHQFLNSPACYANNYPLPDGEEGQGDAQACEQEISHLINQVHGVNNIVAPVLATNPVDEWYAIGGISYLADIPLFHFEQNKLTEQDLIQQADNQICHQQWDNLNQQFPNDEYMYLYCLTSSYFYALIVDGYGLTSDQSINYIPSAQNVDWTIGVVLSYQK